MIIKYKSIKQKKIRIAKLSLQILMFCAFPISSLANPLPVFPLKPKPSGIDYQGKGRFGEARSSENKNPVGFGTYGHQGIDITERLNTDVVAIADSIVVGKGNIGRGAGNGIALKPINGPDIVVAYYHLNRIDKNLPAIGGRVNAGTVIGYVGGTSKPGGPNELGIHLHLGVGVKNGNQVSVTLNNTPSGKQPIYKNGLGGTNASSSSRFGGTYYWSNPAPFLNKDVLISTSSGASDPLIKYFGTSIRTQYNALTGANLTPSSRARLPDSNFPVPKLRITNNGVPSSLETDIAQSGVISILTSENAGDLGSQNTVTPEQIAYYAPPRTIFGGSNGAVTIDVGDGDISHSEMVSKIGSQRYSNHDWQKELIGMSMRGMLSEYLNMINAKNFVKKEQLLQRERVEALYAAWTTQVVRSTLGEQLLETTEKIITPTPIPLVDLTPVEELYERIEAGGSVTAAEMATAISVFKSGEHPPECESAYYNKFISNVPQAKKKEFLALALRMGFHPNDLANAVAFETSFNAESQLYIPRNSRGDVIAAGFIQLTPSGASGIPYKVYDKIFPAGGVIIKRHLGNSFNYNNPHGTYLQELGRANARLEFAVYDGYFYSKNRNFVSTPASQKNAAEIYKQIFGGAQKKYLPNGNINPGYAQNAGLDVNGDDVVSAIEAVQHHKRFRKTRCNYYPDEDILQNRYGLTNDDLKFIPWDSNVAKRVNLSPTLDNLGGHFGFGLLFKERVKNGN